MESQEIERLPREFYEAIVLIRDTFDEFGVPEDVIEEILDAVEALILEALGCAGQEENGTDENGKEHVG